MARPELLDRRPAWAGGKLNATTLSLEPLSEAETDELIAGLLEGSTLDEGLTTRIRRAAGGNPLFVEEMLTFVSRSSNGDEIEVPPTIQALLAARLDQLDPSERHVLERGSVEGEVFHRGAVAALVQDETAVDGRLVALVRKDLVRPAVAQLAGEDGYRFRHLLIRDAAYEALPKATRADLHERFASWLETRGADLVELDEIVGYHLEQAFKYRGELGPLTDSDRGAGARAGGALARSGRRALERGDRRAAASLLERAVKLLPESSPQQVLALVELGRSLADVGHDYEGARVALERASATAGALNREDLLARAQIELSHLDQISADTNPDADEALARHAIEVLERAGDEEGLARAWIGLALVNWARGLWDSLPEPLDKAIEYARRAGNRSMEFQAVTFLLGAVTFGSTPAAEGIATARKVLEEYPDSREVVGWATRVLGTLLALQGEEDKGRELLEHARTIFTDMGHDEAIGVLPFSTGVLELRTGNPEAAERELRAGFELLRGMGERGRASSLAAFLAAALVELGRIDEAAGYVEMSRELLPKDDVTGQAQMTMSHALVLARRGEFDDAVRLAHEAVGMAEGVQELLNLPDLLLWQADVLERAGRLDEAEDALRKAADAAARKGSVVDERRARERLAALSGANE